jgi:tRNA splicing endonuclease
MAMALSSIAHEDTSEAWEDSILIVRKHFERKGYRVHSGLQFGCELVLYADDPSRVHSDFCVYCVPESKWFRVLVLVLYNI